MKKKLQILSLIALVVIGVVFIYLILRELGSDEQQSRNDEYLRERREFLEYEGELPDGAMEIYDDGFARNTFRFRSDEDSIELLFINATSMEHQLFLDDSPQDSGIDPANTIEASGRVLHRYTVPGTYRYSLLDLPDEKLTVEVEFVE